MSIYHKTHKTLNLSPPSLLALGFLGFITFGTLLLKLPFANTGNVSWMDALLQPPPQLQLPVYLF